MNKTQKLLSDAKAIVSDPNRLISGTLVRDGCYCSLGAVGKAAGMSDEDLDMVDSYADTFGDWPAVKALAKAVTEYDNALGRIGHSYDKARTKPTTRIFITSDDCHRSEHEGHDRLMRLFDRAIELAE